MNSQIDDKVIKSLLILEIQEKIASWHQNQVKRTASGCSYKSCTCNQILDSEVGILKQNKFIELEIAQFNSKVVEWHETQVIQKKNRCSYGTCTCLQIIDSEIGVFKKLLILKDKRK